MRFTLTPSFSLDRGQRSPANTGNSINTVSTSKVSNLLLYTRQQAASRRQQAEGRKQKTGRRKQASGIRERVVEAKVLWPLPALLGAYLTLTYGWPFMSDECLFKAHLLIVVRLMSIWYMYFSAHLMSNWCPFDVDNMSVRRTWVGDLKQRYCNNYSPVRVQRINPLVAARCSHSIR